MGFSKPNAAPKPTKFCTGTIGSVMDAKMTGSGVYVNQSVKIKGDGASEDTFAMFLYRPQWLDPAFDALYFDVPEDNPEFGERRSQKFVYNNNILSSRDNQLSVLQGLCGNPATFDKVAAQLQKLPQPTNERERESFIGSVQKIIESLSNPIGYVLRQATEPVKDEDGNKVYDNDGNVQKTILDKYEISEWFEVTPTNLKKLRKRAEAVNKKKPGSVLCAFDGE